MLKFLLRSSLVVLVFMVLPFVGGLVINYGWPWQEDPPFRYYGTTGAAPSADGHPQAIVQVYAARAARWRGIFGVHSWIAYKPAGADAYERAEVIGWGAQYRSSVVVKRPGSPDQYWYGKAPDLLFELRGEAAEQAIAQLESAIESYPYADRYRVWPGPNSNTFTAHVLREVDLLRVDLPPTAIGKDYVDGPGLMPTPSNTGYQFSVYGVLGASLALEEGFEINLGGANYGLDLNWPAIRIPAVGRLGFPN